ncbi:MULTISPECIES: hypothetical protein [unclassified Marinovum]
MLIGLVMLSAVFGAICGLVAIISGVGLIGSLAIYAVVGQVPYLLYVIFIFMTDDVDVEAGFVSGVSARF